MFIYKSCFYRIYPTKSQTQVLEAWTGSCRFLYNQLVDSIKDRLTVPTRVNLINRAVTLKSIYNFLYDVPAQALQQVAMDVARAASMTRYPYMNMHYRKRGNKDSIRIPQQVLSKNVFQKLSRRTFRLNLPKKVVLRVRGGIDISDKDIRSITLKKDAKGWIAAIQWREEISDNHVSTGEPVGIDFGVNIPLQCSNGDKYEVNNSIRKRIDLLNRRRDNLYHRLATKESNSKNRAKTRNLLARTTNRLKMIWSDIRHKWTRTICDRHPVVMIEKLCVKGMTKRQGKWKSTRTRHIMELGWYQLYKLLEYKQYERDNVLILVSPEYTSQRCSQCGNISKKNRVSQEEFKCTSCNYSCNADLNASINILAKGLH